MVKIPESKVQSQKSGVDSKYLVNGYYPTIGIECHVQLKTKSKLFSTASNEARGAEPNTLVNHVCFGLPGALPVLNKEAVRLASKAAYALGTRPQKFSKFDRKHYFYPDLPKGYQISQYDQPIILDGKITIHLENGIKRVINITRAHLEEDAGKSTHPTGDDYSLVDLNRAGTPLLEIVSEPELHNSEEAKAYAKELWLAMKYSGVSDVDLYHGNMRFDVNVSVSKDPTKFGTRSETKNLNSFKSVEKAVDYEINRQIDLLEKGEKVIQETRGWLDDKQKTVSQRSKEDAHDYRYFPDPDIPPVVLDEEYLMGIESSLNKTPEYWRSALEKISLSKLQTEALLEAQAELGSSYLELVTSHTMECAKTYANWIINFEVPLRRELLEKSGDLKIDDNIREKLFEQLYLLQKDGKLSSNNVKALLVELLSQNKLPDSVEKYAENAGYIQVNDSAELEQIIEKVITENPKPVADVQNGEMKAIGFLVGQVMKASAGKANPAMVQQIIRDKLKV